MKNNEAIIQAHKKSRETNTPFYAIERPLFNDWIVSERKPSMRMGKVIECYDGKENLA